MTNQVFQWLISIKIPCNLSESIHCPKHCDYLRGLTNHERPFNPSTSKVAELMWCMPCRFVWFPNLMIIDSATALKLENFRSWRKAFCFFEQDKECTAPNDIQHGVFLSVMTQLICIERTIKSFSIRIFSCIWGQFQHKFYFSNGDIATCTRQYDSNIRVICSVTIVFLCGPPWINGT